MQGLGPGGYIGRVQAEGAGFAEVCLPAKATQTLFLGGPEST